MKKWEYEVVTVFTKGFLSIELDVESFKKTLTLMGQDGWELIDQTAFAASGSTHYIICTFKRELAQ